MSMSWREYDDKSDFLLVLKKLCTLHGLMHEIVVADIWSNHVWFVNRLISGTSR